MATYDVDLCRIYYEGREVGKHWSVDFGPGTPVMLVGSISLAGVSAQTFVEVAAVKPVGWLFMERVTVEVDEARATALIRLKTA